MITRQNRLEKIWVNKGTDFAVEFKRLCEVEGLQVHSAMSLRLETKAALAERTIRFLKNVLFCYMEDYPYKPTL